MISKIKNIYEDSKIIRFGFFGVINTFLGFVTYPILYYFFSNYLTYMEILYLSFFICTQYAFFTTKYYVFRSKKNFIKEYLKFMMFHFLMLAINMVYLPIFVEILFIHPSISQIIFNFFIVVSSYIWHLKVTFNN